MFGGELLRVLFGGVLLLLLLLPVAGAGYSVPEGSLAGFLFVTIWLNIFCHHLCRIAFIVPLRRGDQKT